MQVCDIPMSGFTNWTEHPNANTLSVNSNGILFLSKSENHENEGDILLKITFGSRTSMARKCYCPVIPGVRKWPLATLSH